MDNYFEMINDDIVVTLLFKNISLTVCFSVTDDDKEDDGIESYWLVIGL